MAVVSPSSEEQRDDDQRLPPSFPRPHHLVSPQRFSTPPSVSLLFAAEYHRSLVRREANDRLLLSPLSPSACSRTTTIKFREPTVDLVVSPSSSAYSAEEPSSLADWAELQSDSISEEEDLISVDDLMDDDRTAQTSPDDGHQDRSKPVFEGAGMDVSYHEDRNANLADEPDKTAVDKPLSSPLNHNHHGDHHSHQRTHIDTLDFGSEVSTTDGTSSENTGREGSITGNEETAEEGSEGDEPTQAADDEEKVDGENAPDSAVDTARSVLDESVGDDDGGDSAGNGNVHDNEGDADPLVAQSEEITDLKAEGNEDEDAIDNGSNDGDKTGEEIEEEDTRSQKGDEDVASIEDGAAASPAPSDHAADVSIAARRESAGSQRSAASQKIEEDSIKSDEAARSPPAQSPTVSPRQHAAEDFPIESRGSDRGSINGEDGNTQDGQAADDDGEDTEDKQENTTEQPDAQHEVEQVDLEPTIENGGAERVDGEIEEPNGNGGEENETEEPTEEGEAALNNAMEPIDAADKQQEEEEGDEQRRPSLDANDAPLSADGDAAAAGSDQGEEAVVDEEPPADESMPQEQQQQEMPDEFVMVDSQALSMAAVEHGGIESEQVVEPVVAQQASPGKKKTSTPKKMPKSGGNGHFPAGKPPSGKTSVAMKKSQSMASGPMKTTSRPPTSLPISPKKPSQRPKSQEPPVRRTESSPARQASRPKTTEQQELDPEKQAEKEARRADAEAAFQSWLQRKRSERRRARSSGRQEDADVKSGDESKEAKKAEAEAAFQAWLDRKRAAQRKEKMGVIGRQDVEQSSDAQRHDDPFETWKQQKAEQRRAERRLERARQRELDATIVPLGSSMSSISSLNGVARRAKRDSLPRLNGRRNVRMVSAKLRSRSTANVGQVRTLPLLSTQTTRSLSMNLV